MIMIKKLLYNLQKFDGIWSIPIAFIGFFLAGKYSFEYFGDAIISTEYLQFVILTSLIMVFANFVIKEDIKKDLTTWQRVKLYLFVYFGFLCIFLFILYMLMTVTA